jgi:hypothetical protein
MRESLFGSGFESDKQDKFYKLMHGSSSDGEGEI